MRWLRGPSAQLRRRLAAAVDRRVAARLAEELPRAVQEAIDRARDARLLEPRVWGPPERISIAAGAEVANAYFNTVSGSIFVGEGVVFGHDVAVLAVAYSDERLEGARRPLPDGADVAIGRGARIGARAVLVGPCHVGAYAVIGEGAVVTGAVAAGAVLAGAPATVSRTLGVEDDLPPSLEVASDVGPLRVLLGDEVITPALSRDGRWEPEHADALRGLLRPGMTVVDIGANIGYTALVAAEAVAPDGRVIAVEPHPDNVRLLRANAERNGEGRIEVVAAAAWREPGTVRLAISDVNAGDHRTEALVGDRTSVEVPAVRLDDVVGDRRVDLVKLDCQGCEHVVLAGAHGLVERSRPVLVAEFWPIGIRQLGDDPLTVLRGYRGLGYELRVLEEPALGDAPDDEAILAAVEARPDPVGGFATLVMTPAGSDRPLGAYEARVRSQNGEDGVIAEITRRIGAPGRFFVEFGAEDGAEGNCAALADAGWSGVLIEGDPEKFAALEARWRERPDVRTLHARVEPGNLEELLRAADAPREIDVLSIDIDSNDWYVWEALAAFSARLVVIEYNAALPLDRRLVQPLDLGREWDGSDYFGASLGAYEALAERKGYALVHTEARGINAFFVRRDLLAGTGLPTGSDVERHRADYFGTGRGHPRDSHDRPWVDLDADGELVRVTR